MPRRNRAEIIDTGLLEPPLTVLEPLSLRRRSRSRINPALLIGGLTVAAGVGLT